MKSNILENKKNEFNSPQKFHLNLKNKIKFKNKLFSSKINLYKRNSDNSEDKFKFESPKSKFSSFSPSTKNQTITKLKDDSNSQNNINNQSLNKSLSFSSFKSNLKKRHKNFIKLKKDKNFFSFSDDKSINQDNETNQNNKTRNMKIKNNTFLFKSCPFNNQ